MYTQPCYNQEFSLILNNIHLQIYLQNSTKFETRQTFTFSCNEIYDNFTNYIDGYQMSNNSLFGHILLLHINNDKAKNSN